MGNMRLITPFEFLARFPVDKSLIFVGNAPSLTGEGLGEWIDSHDIIVRFNECPIAGYEKDVGRRTSILVSNPYPEGRGPISVLSEKPTLLIFNPQTRRGDISVFEEWAGDHDVLFTYTPDLLGVKKSEHVAGLTTGSYALYLLSKLCQPSRISVTGFTMFLEDTFFHYFRLVRSKGIDSHDMKRESQIFVRICNYLSKKNLEVTEDVAWVARRARVKLHRKISVRSLTTKKWKK